jgi:hypothetical protein
MIKDVLKDVVAYTHKLGVINLVKIVGSTTSTDIVSISDDKTVIIYGKLKAVLPEFDGVFGMPNLEKLQTILNFEEYDDSAVINVSSEVRDNVNVPVGIHFETQNKDFVNDYRLMSKLLVEEKIKNVTFKGAPWHVTFVPSVESILKLKKQFNANSDQTHFTVKTDNNNLKVYFGDAYSHNGNFVFEPNVSGTISNEWCFPVKVFLTILNLAGDKTIKISDKGVANITVDSWLAVYDYYLPAAKK